MVITLALLAMLSGSGFMFMQQKQFGADPKGARLERIKKSPNYKNGAFQNLSYTPVMAEGYSYWKVSKEYFKKVEGKEPVQNIPSVTTNLNQLPQDTPSVVWFGHSSYLITINGKRILVDPVFSGNAAPLSFMVKNYSGSNVYGVDDLPNLDAVLITHDHYDHLDYETILKLIPKTKHFYTSLGVGAHLAYWGVDESKITEFDWWERAAMDSDMFFTATPARHFSGRKFTRGKTLWASYVLEVGKIKLFLGGDSGFDTHFEEIGKRFGPFDLAILECGQYNPAWHNIHMLPNETVLAATQLKAKVLMPVHNSKFTLALHAWNAPHEAVVDEAARLNQPITTPLIGEPVLINTHYPQQKWWQSIK